ncbi:T9SS type A sorting domain-containing protein [uncultured Muribaculum sp.]|jgi:hypothetical protein|uniref:T9SS type A sorting domain-containing protein n=1 Tax=uncultured Muribaculum sp. TaxID=1918613 RepID=UPI002589C31C|nr:T9SS type A sorting domain-containing protein [uncultured Muribaculum sp.]
MKKFIFLIITIFVFNFNKYAQTINPSIIVYSYDDSGCTTSRLDPNNIADYMSLKKFSNDTLAIKASPTIVDTQITISIAGTNNNYDAIASIFSIDGERISQYNVTSPSTNINLSTLRHGIYILNVNIDKNIKSFKFVKL